MTFYPLILQCRFPKNKDILLHNFCLVQLSNSRNLTLIQYYSYFSFVNCPNNKLKKLFPFSQGSHIALSCHVSLVFFNLEQFLAFLYPSWHWHFLCTQATFSFFFSLPPPFLFLFLHLESTPHFGFVSCFLMIRFRLYVSSMNLLARIDNSVLLRISYVAISLIGDTNFDQLVMMVLYLSTE